uniref:Uncharacterized protein n=1 Tax=viral metagenome TaxID=1070528 RepID=A0A6M3Y474_9ZZZZ
MLIRAYCIFTLLLGSVSFGVSQNSILAGVGLFLVVFSVLFLIEFND